MCIGIKYYELKNVIRLIISRYFYRLYYTLSFKKRKISKFIENLIVFNTIYFSKHWNFFMFIIIIIWSFRSRLRSDFVKDKYHQTLIWGELYAGIFLGYTMAAEPENVEVSPPAASMHTYQSTRPQATELRSELLLFWYTLHYYLDDNSVYTYIYTKRVNGIRFVIFLFFLLYTQQWRFVSIINSLVACSCDTVIQYRLV